MSLLRRTPDDATMAELHAHVPALEGALKKHFGDDVVFGEWDFGWNRGASIRRAGKRHAVRLAYTHESGNYFIHSEDAERLIASLEEELADAS